MPGTSSVRRRPAPLRVAPFHTGAGVISAQRASYCSAPPLHDDLRGAVPLILALLDQEIATGI